MLARRLRAVVLLPGVLLAAACGALLGGDFEMASSDGGTSAEGGGTSAGGGGGAAGGTGGGTGASSPLPLRCEWRLPQHQLAISLEGMPLGEGRQWQERISAVDAGEYMRAFTSRWDPIESAAVVDVLTLRDGQAFVTQQQADRVLDVRRLDDAHLAALYQTRGMAGSGGGASSYPQLSFRVMDDANIQNPGGDVYPINDELGFPDCGDDWRINARFAPLAWDGTSLHEAAVYGSYQTADLLYREIYFHFDFGAGPSAPVGISQPGAALSSQDVEPGPMTHVESNAYLFVGEPGSELGMREYELNESVSGVLSARTFTPLSLTAIGVEARGDGTANVALGDITDLDGVRVLVGKVPSADLYSLQPEALLVAGQYAAVGDLPVGESDLKWIGDMFVLLGVPPASDRLELSIMLFDVEGHERAWRTLDVQHALEPDVNRLGIQRVAIASAGGDFNHSLGGQLHVAWIERLARQATPNESYDAIFYDELGCYPSEGD